MTDPIYHLSFGDIEIFQPKMISIRRLNKTLVSTIKCISGQVRFGFVSQDWVFWFLTEMRDSNVIGLIVRNNRFSNGFTINEGNYGPISGNYANHPNYKLRCIKTYLDDETNFFFA